MKEILNYEDYKRFLEIANYDYLDPEVVENNNIMMNKSVKELTDEEIKRFSEKGRRVGCCFNFSMYLFAKYKGLVLTCSDIPGTHCVFLYIDDDDNLFVCDPARAKIEDNGNDYFNIPINEYFYKEEENKAIGKKQVYKIYYKMQSDDINQSFINNFKNGEKTFNFYKMSDIDDEDKKVIIDIINPKLTTTVD